MLLAACNSTPPDWLLTANHAVSPDGVVYVYQYSDEGGDSTTISISTHHLSTMAGGAGVFDIISPEDALLELSWESDSTAIISYPSTARILRKEDVVYYFGRNTYFRYEPIEPVGE